jgi:protein-S-isoprenylcysteine O-methyltransferase Ste14
VTDAPAPKHDRFLVRALDICERVFLLVLFGVLVVSIRHGVALKPYNILVVLQESLGVLFIVTRRYSNQLTLRPLDWLAAFLGTGLPLMVKPGGQAVLSPIVGSVLMVGGLLLALWALLVLRRSFGLAAANRGVVQGGPYRLVRHPIYLGYLCAHIGFLLNNPTWWNAGLYLVATSFQIWRILAEERVLGDDPAYAAFRRKVRWRLAPGLF